MPEYSASQEPSLFPRPQYCLSLTQAFINKIQAQRCAVGDIDIDSLVYQVSSVFQYTTASPPDLRQRRPTMIASMPNTRNLLTSSMKREKMIYPPGEDGMIIHSGPSDLQGTLRIPQCSLMVVCVVPQGVQYSNSTTFSTLNLQWDPYHQPCPAQLSICSWVYPSCSPSHRCSLRSALGLALHRKRG